MIKYNYLSNVFYIFFILYLLTGCDYKEKNMEINITFESNETKEFDEQKNYKTEISEQTSDDISETIEKEQSSKTQEYSQTKSSEQNKIYLNEMNIDELFKEFLCGNITIQNPFVPDDNLNAFGWEKLYTEWTYNKDDNYKCARKFALVDLDGDGKDELIFSAGEYNDFEEVILLLHSDGKQLNCWDIYETHTQRMGTSIYSSGIVNLGNTIEDDYYEDVYYQYKSEEPNEIIHFSISYNNNEINSDFGSYYLNRNKKEIYLISNNDEYKKILKEYVGEMKAIIWFNCDDIADIN